MDEEKAAAYYDEMCRKGGGAAKLKQGLGYAASSSPPPPSYGAFPSFVKGGEHSENLAKQEKESRLSSVRDKLKKRLVEDDETYGDRDRHYPRSQEKTSRRDLGHGHLANGRGRSRSPVREHAARRERRNTHRRHISRSSSSSSRDRRSRSRSYSSDSSYRKRGRHSRDRSISKREKRSSSKRSHSLSPRAHGSDNPHHAHGDPRKASHPSRRRLSPSPEKQRKRERRKEQTHNARKADTCDYSKLVPGYDDMTPAEKIKQKMKLQLSEIVSKDTARGMDTEWERFTFDKNAPLDDDAKLDYFGDGTGAQDDTSFLQNTGSTFLSTCSQAKREAQIQAAHDAAIFGPFAGLSSKREGAHGKESHLSSTKETTIDDDITIVQVEEPRPIDSLLSDQVLTFQQGSWRERALKLKQQRPTSTIT